MKLFFLRSIVPFLLVALVFLNSCTTVIDTKLDTGPIQLSVDAVLSDQPGPQAIRLTQTAPYFDNRTPPVAAGATVTVADNTGKTYAFTDADNDGYYTWDSTNDTLGHIGRTYNLSITYQGETYQASSTLNRVPSVDSITFVKTKLNPLSKTEGYRAELYARDLPGTTNYYRIRFFRNNELQNQPANIILAQDASSFEGGADTDGLLFIQPLRRSINPDSLYTMNDTLKVEIQSLTAESFNFWQQLRTQLTNIGLFATPPANLPTNLVNINSSGRKATGFFITSAVRSRTAIVSTTTIRASED